ncbi:exodeoxyribonuclease III [Clostridium weizhouense]|uniref:Exodeoxyribonuclease III n=1 Tax=Clostridium weizhouense TaxID=2859781 RepID=A0ABS7ALC2_9CLOT|nr:exodeoxyribonuclease III [Clostridium weizhouense]MBW6409457.1 exodeoxyribonuclease III [Clostridium weizhouense]
MKKLISWNVNGLRACVKKGFLDVLKENDADIFCIQESKLQEGQIDLQLDGYYDYWNYAEKKGYSGTAIFAKEKALDVKLGIGIEEHDKEGRVITLEYEDFYIVNVYTPNSQQKLARIDYRMKWEEAFREYLKELEKRKPVILCGDLNVAHNEIDLKNPKSNRKNAGFSDQEREKISKLLESGFIDTYRYFYPDKEGVYSWWSYRFNARENNAGWRIDYFLVSKKLENRLVSATIHTEIMGSDHCPVELVIK